MPKIQREKNQNVVENLEFPTSTKKKRSKRAFQVWNVIKVSKTEKKNCLKKIPNGWNCQKIVGKNSE